MIELEPKRDSSDGIPEVTGLEVVPKSQDEEFNVSNIPNLKRAKSFIKGLKLEFWNSEMYRKDRMRANIRAKMAVADVVYSIRPKSGDFSDEANNARRSIHLLVEAAEAHIETVAFYTSRPEEIFYGAISDIVARRNDNSDNIVFLE